MILAQTFYTTQSQFLKRKRKKESIAVPFLFADNNSTYQLSLDELSD